MTGEQQWNSVVVSLEDVYKANNQLSLDSIYNEQLSKIDEISSAEELQELRDQISKHRANTIQAQEIVELLIEKTTNIFRQVSHSDKGPAQKQQQQVERVDEEEEEEALSPSVGAATSASTTAAHTHESGVDADIAEISSSTNNDKSQKKGKSYYQSLYNPNEPIIPGSEVAFKLRQRGQESEWIQCEVTKIISEIKFEVRDPEPDENNNPGRSYKANWKDIILLPPLKDEGSMINYPYGTKVLARYPETTTFYPAEVLGTKRDGRCRLRFDGEEEEGKETEVERRLVVPYPK